MSADDVRAGDDRTLYEGAHLRLVDRGGWEFVQRISTPRIVLILAVNAAGELVLVEQLRPPLGRAVIELPAGLAGDIAGQEDEELAEAARRELLEETGYEAEELVLRAAGAPSAGVTDEVLHLFEARGLRKVGPGGGDESEDITVHEVPLGDVEEFLAAAARDGKAIDLKIWGGLHFARLP